MRDTVRVAVSHVGSPRCHVLSVRGVAAAPVPLGAHVLWASRPTASRRVPMRHQLEFVVRTIAAAWRYRERLVIVCGHPNLSAVAWLASRVAKAPFVNWVYGKE